MAEAVPLTLGPDEAGLIRVFAYAADKDMVASLNADPGLFAPLLGVDRLDPAHVEVLRLADLGDVGLPGYLAEGNDVDPRALAADMARLLALTGYVLLLHSAALPQGGVLRPVPALTLIGTYPQSGAAPAQLWPATPAAAVGSVPRAGRASPGRSLTPAGPIIALVALIIIGTVWWLA